MLTFSFVCVCLYMHAGFFFFLHNIMTCPSNQSPHGPHISIFPCSQCYRHYIFLTISFLCPPCHIIALSLYLPNLDLLFWLLFSVLHFPLGIDKWIWFLSFVLEHSWPSCSGSISLWLFLVIPLPPLFSAIRVPCWLTLSWNPKDVVKHYPLATWWIDILNKTIPVPEEFMVQCKV